MINMTNYEAPATIPTKEEIFKTRNKPVVINHSKKLTEFFPMATIEAGHVAPYTHHKPASVIDISKLERNIYEKVHFFYCPMQSFFECHPLDLTLEELIAIYQGDMFITYNEEYFHKYETVIRIAHGMKP